MGEGRKKMRKQEDSRSKEILRKNYVVKIGSGSKRNEKEISDKPHTGGGTEGWSIKKSYNW